MLKAVEYFEKFITTVLIFFMTLVILIGTIDLCFTLSQEIIAPPFLLLNVSKLTSLFGFFFMILIGLELLETIKTYLTKEQIHVEIVFLVAMIAIARKVILLDVKHLDPATMLGIAAIIIALAGGYYMVKKAHVDKVLKKKK